MRDLEYFKSTWWLSLCSKWEVTMKSSWTTDDMTVSLFCLILMVL